MLFKEFGNKDLPKIVVLHGGGLSWWSLEPVISVLSQTHFVIAPIIDGHGEDGNTTFISITESSKKLVAYIDDMYNGHIYALCGLSIGAQIAVDILSRRKDICQFAVIESALVRPLKIMRTFLLPMITISYPLIKQKWYSKIQAKALFVPSEKIDRYHDDSCRISKTSLINISISNGSFVLDAKIKETKAKVLILVGEKEIAIMKRSATDLNEAIPNSQLKIISNSGHGELSLLRPKEYCSLLYELFGTCES